MARSIGFEGDVERLWAEAQEQAQAQAPDLLAKLESNAEVPLNASTKPSVQASHDPAVTLPPESPARHHEVASPQKPVATDTLLATPSKNHSRSLHSLENAVGHVCASDTSTTSPQEAASSYPQSPPSSAGTPGMTDSPPANGYPVSPRTGDGWMSAVESAHEAQPSSQAASNAGQSTRGLPSSVKDLFRRAEVLCEQQLYHEAVPLFKKVLQILDETSRDKPVPAVVTAEVWAHLGVAMQSIDQVPDAIHSYEMAVSLDPSLHVCFANLATLHAFLNEKDRAIQYIDRDWRLTPGAILTIQSRFIWRAPLP